MKAKTFGRVKARTKAIATFSEFAIPTSAPLYFYAPILYPLAENRGITFPSKRRKIYWH